MSSTIGTCSFCGDRDKKVAVAESFEASGAGEYQVGICRSCVTRAEESIDGVPRVAEPAEGLDSDELPTSPQAIDAETMALLYPDHLDDAPCLDCGRVWAEHETFAGDDECFFTLNDEANRLGRARREVRLLLDRGMTPEEIVNTVYQVRAVRGGFDV